VAIIRELKGINRITGVLRQGLNVFNRPRKMIREIVGIGLPVWDPPPPRPPAAPDHATVKRAEGKISLSVAEERQALDRVLGNWRRTKAGEPRPPAAPDQEPPPPPGRRPRPGVTEQPSETS
jgi:hypothetical protein